VDKFGIRQVVVKWIYVAQETVTFQRTFSCVPGCKCFSQISFTNIASSNRQITCCN